MCLPIDNNEAAVDLPLEQIKLPPGFAIERWSLVENARQQVVGEAALASGFVVGFGLTDEQANREMTACC